MSDPSEPSEPIALRGKPGTGDAGDGCRPSQAVSIKPQAPGGCRDTATCVSLLLTTSTDHEAKKQHDHGPVKFQTIKNYISLDKRLLEVQAFFFFSRSTIHGLQNPAGSSTGAVCDQWPLRAKGLQPEPDPPRAARIEPLGRPPTLSLVPPPALPHQVGPLSIAPQCGPGQAISELQTLMSSPAKPTVLEVWLSPLPLAPS